MRLTRLAGVIALGSLLTLGNQGRVHLNPYTEIYRWRGTGSSPRLINAPHSKIVKIEVGRKEFGGVGTPINGPCVSFAGYAGGRVTFENGTVRTFKKLVTYQGLGQGVEAIKGS